MDLSFLCVFAGSFVLFIFNNEDERKMKCVITGGTGLIGRRLLQRLLSCGWTIYSIVHSDVHITNSLHYNQYVFDLSHPGKMDLSFLPKSVDAVIHLVQSNNYKDFPAAASDMFYTNINSTFNMLEFARKNGVKNFVLASSGGIYGSGPAAFRESDSNFKHDDLGFYLSTKICGETLAENYKDFMNVIILRFFFVYGEMQKDVMLLPRLVKSIDTGKPIILQGNDGININPIYVDDAVDAIARVLLLNDSYNINIAGREIVSLRQLAIMMGSIVSKEPVFQIEDKLPRHLVADTKRMEELLGSPKVSLDDGLKRMINSMKARGLICR